MSDFLPFVVVGIVTGSVYGLAAMGLVLTYKTTGIFNFAYGAVATGGAYLFYWLRVRQGIPWPIAAVLTLIAVAGLAGPATELIGRSLQRVPIATQIVATIGLLLAIQGAVMAWFGPSTLDFPPILPQRTIAFPGVNVGLDQLVIVVLSAGLALGLFVFFRRSRLGLAMQAVVDNPSLLGLAGTNVARARRAAWVIGLSLAAVSGVLLAPGTGLNAPLLTLLVVQAFGAGAIGGFSNLPLTYAGGLLIGIVAALSTKYLPQVPGLVGLPASIPFLVLFALLVLAPSRLATRRDEAPTVVEQAKPLPPLVRRVGPVVAIAVALLIPTVVGSRLPVYTSAAIYVILFASLALLVRTSGQVSLCHAAFAAVGASTFSHLTTGAGLPWLLALLLAGLLTVPVGALVAIPAIRLSGLYLALATFGFGVLMQQLVYRTSFMFGRSGPLAVPRPDVAGLAGDRAFYYVVVTFAVVTCVAVAAVHRSRLGRLLRALSDSPLALAAQGTSVATTRVLVFCLSAFLAGVAGGLFGALSGFIDGAPFDAFMSLLFLAVLAISGAGELRAAVVAAVLVAVVPSYLGRYETVVDYQPVAFGLGAVAVALVEANRRDLDGAIHRAAQRARQRRERGPVAARLDQAQPLSPARAQ